MESHADPDGDSYSDGHSYGNSYCNGNRQRRQHAASRSYTNATASADTAACANCAVGSYIDSAAEVERPRLRFPMPHARPRGRNSGELGLLVNANGCGELGSLAMVGQRGGSLVPRPD